MLALDVSASPSTSLSTSLLPSLPTLPTYLCTFLLSYLPEHKLRATSSPTLDACTTPPSPLPLPSLHPNLFSRASASSDLFLYRGTDQQLIIHHHSFLSSWTHLGLSSCSSRPSPQFQHPTSSVHVYFTLKPGSPHEPFYGVSTFETSAWGVGRSASNATWALDLPCCVGFVASGTDRRPLSPSHHLAHGSQPEHRVSLWL